MLNDHEVRRLYAAKCQDLKLPFYEQQLDRFFDFANESSNRKLVMREVSGITLQVGFGIESAKVFCSLIRSGRVAQIDLT